jgi:hypothetical protein
VRKSGKEEGSGMLYCGRIAKNSERGGKFRAEVNVSTFRNLNMSQLTYVGVKKTHSA